MRLEQENTSILLWWIIGGIVVLVGLYVAYAQFFANSAAPQTAPPAQVVKAAPVTPAAQAQVSNVATTATAASEPLTLVDENILKAPVSENATMAKDEMAKLDDVQKQLTDQESTLTQQHQDADALIKLKEEQIKLLEAQLAQQQADS